MITNKAAFKYGQGLFELAIEEGKVDTTLAELAEVVEVVDQNQELFDVLHHPRLGKKKKKEIMTEIFKEEITKNLLNFLQLLIDKNRIEYLADIYQEFKHLVETERGEASLTVEVQSPIELDDTRSDKLKAKLEEMLDKQIELVIDIKPQLLGGLVLKIGDKVIDGSIERQLKNLKDNIKSLEVSKLGVKWNES